MQGNFTYYNPTKLYFGEESLNKLKGELANFGQTVLLMIDDIVSTTVIYPAGYLDLTTEDIKELLKESL